MEKILECNGLCKNFGKKEILKNVSFDIEKGDILAFIGPNGSGKTTTIKLILGLQKINSGSVRINGFDITTDFIKAIEKVGAIVENPDTYMYLTGMQNLRIIARCYGIKDKQIMNVVKYVGLEKRINDKVSKYSLGMRQRLGIARALLNNPNVLILDEPTNGLDPEGIKELRDLLKKLAKDGMGILISSHNLAELESFCNKVCVINNGVIVETNEVKAFKSDENRVVFEVNNVSKIKLDNIKIIDENHFEINASKEDISKIIQKLVNQKIDIYEVKTLELSLEEAFLKKTAGGKNA